LITFLIIISIYALGIFSLSIVFALSKEDEYEINQDENISILIPFKNEEANLKNLLNNLLELKYPNNKLEIIFINDNSTDQGNIIVEEFIKTNNINIKLLCLTNENGKKQALKKGIENSSGSIIIHTDADVMLNKNWINSIVSSFKNKKTMLSYGSVLFNNENNLFEKFQSIELLSLTGIGASTGIIKHPILISGANLAYRDTLKQDFIDSINNLDSGDDMFFLENIKKKYTKAIKYIKTKDNIVFTNAENNLKAFINQRLRWAGKTSKIKDFEILLAGVLSFSANLSIIILAMFSFINFNLLSLFIASILIKFIFEFISLFIYSEYFKKHSYIYLFPVLFFVYPLYIIGISIISLIIKHKWK
jgi:cellulose synthase/poly-beta-1,6-N-acetylglucosamine synthase-like glycosyltransferase